MAIMDTDATYISMHHGSMVGCDSTNLRVQLSVGVPFDVYREVNKV